MTVEVVDSAFASPDAQSVRMSQILSVTADGSNPTYLIVSGLDRDEYTAGESGTTGTLSGDGESAAFTAIGGDERGVGIVFTWDAASGTYENATYGNLLDLTYNSSASAGELADLSFFGTNTASLTSAYADDSVTMAVNPGDWTDYGTATFATQAVGAATATTQATPDSICSTAMKFVGDAWNDEGCWLLASTIDAEAGAGLTVASSAVGTAGVDATSSEWKVAYNGPASANGAWESLLRAGDQVVFEPAGGGGHITTVVSGSGTSAMLVDNMAYAGGANSAHDGSASDITVLAPHPASQEFTGVNAATVVVYRLDTPTVTGLVANDALGLGQSQSLAALFSASDWAGTRIVAYQAYATPSYGSITVNGVASSTARSAATAAASASLGGLGFLAGSAAGTDTVELRAENASGYWGDWSSVTVAVSGSAPATKAAPPKLTDRTGSQSVLTGHALSFALAADTFTDPQGQALTYTAALSSRAALPGWLAFDAATGIFSGTAPSTAQTLTIRVTATDTSNLAATETFTLAVKAPPPPRLVKAIATQKAYEGHAFSFAVAGTFVDPNSEALTYTATLANGAALPSWLSFNATTQTFSGVAPATASNTAIKLTATDTGGGVASASFTLSDVLDTPAARSASAQVTGGTAFSIVLPANLFTDPLGESLTYSLTQANGQALPSWLHFNASTRTLSGTGLPTPVVKTTALKLTATNTDGGSASESFRLTDRPPAAPTVTGGTLGATVYAGQAVALSGGSFTDPQGMALTYAATLANGQALPSWLSFDPATLHFSGTAPTTAGTTPIKLTATDSGGAVKSQILTVGDKGVDTPTLAHRTTASSWTVGTAANLAVAANTFTDPLGEHLTYSVTEANGQALPSGLSFNPATDTISGTCPITPGSLGLQVTATNTSGRSATERVAVAIHAAAPVASGHTGSVILLDSQPVSVALASGFTDPQASALRFTAIETSGPNAASWLHIDSQTGVLSGIAPATGAGSLAVRVTAIDRYGLSTSENLGLAWGAAGAAQGVTPGTTSELIALHA